MNIVVDGMGGDFAPKNVIDGIKSALGERTDIRKLLITGDEETLKKQIDESGLKDKRVEIVHASQVVEMHDPATAPLRQKKDSSISVAADLVKNGDAEAIFSAGHTGASVAATSVKWRMLKGVDEAFFHVEKFLNFIAAIVILAIMLIGTYQVFGRKLLNLPVPGYVDWIEMIMTVFAFVAISYTQRLGGHIRMEIIIGRFQGRILYFLEIVGTVAAIIIVSILAYYAYTHFERAFDVLLTFDFAKIGLDNRADGIGHIQMRLGRR